MLSLMYGLVIRVMAAFYAFRPYRLSCKVISIGNITLGGTGKTVLVEYVAGVLRERGYIPAIITRGYKRKTSNLSKLGENYESMGDEPFMLLENLSSVPAKGRPGIALIVNPDRISAAHAAIRDYKADTVIMDDAFQQWHIKKDLNIVVVDAANPFGNRQMIPRGILREPLSALKRADVFLLTKTNISPESGVLKGQLKNINSNADIFESRHSPQYFYPVGQRQNRLELSAFDGRSAVLFCGIADPDSFVTTLRHIGIRPESVFKYPDHYSYTQADMDNIAAEAKAKQAEVLITTEKDAARLSGLRLAGYELQILVLRIAIEIKDEQRFVDRLLRVYSS